MNRLDLKKHGYQVASKISGAKAKYPVISECPVCHHDLIVERLACEHCGSEIDGSFKLSKFNYLDTDKLYFIEVFVKNRGNIKAIEKEMELSYPTIKKMLDDVITELGYSPENNSEEEVKNREEEVKKAKASRSEILDRLAKKEISADEAAEMLKKLN